MLPLYDHNPTTRPSFVTPALIAINIVVFLFVQPTFASGSKDARAEKQIVFTFCRAAIPYEVTHGSPVADARPAGLDEIGREVRALERERCPHKHVWFAILTSMFLHASFLHIAGNMLFLWIFGNNVEDVLGKVKYVLFYLACGLAATVAQTYVGPNSTIPMVGASGAIAGVLGAYIVLFPRARVRTLIFAFFILFLDIPAAVLLGIWFLLQVFQGAGSSLAHAGSNVAYMAHVGGFLAGILLLLVLRPGRRGREYATR